MLSKLINSRKWDKVVTENNIKGLYLEVIQEFFKADLIDSIKFNNNFIVVDSSWQDQIMFKEKFKEIPITHSINHFTDSFNRPMGIPTWFLAAYPDVAYWISNNLDSLKGHPPFDLLFSDNSDIEEKVCDSMGYFKHYLLRSFIDHYRKTVNKKLECRI